MKNKRRPWIALYSHTGKEILDIYKYTKFIPDVILSTNAKLLKYNEVSSPPILYQPKWTSEDYIKIFDFFDNPLVTLHGWMRIVPADVCNAYEIYNGHPALISKYPELKGKDKQEDVVNKVYRYPYIGSVVHRCTPELDSGEIVYEEQMHNIEVKDKAIIYEILRKTSLLTWIRFFNERL